MFLNSCSKKKDYICTCSFEYLGQTVPVVPDTITDSKLSEAEEFCSTKESSNDSTTTCILIELLK